MDYRKIQKSTANKKYHEKPKTEEQKERRKEQLRLAQSKRREKWNKPKPKPVVFQSTWLLNMESMIYGCATFLCLSDVLTLMLVSKEINRNMIAYISFVLHSKCIRTICEAIIKQESLPALYSPLNAHSNLALKIMMHIATWGVQMKRFAKY